tara:strand:+ start:91 stop:759 length:669 start_codon:yes stop_codon:yes gene_type:complete
MKEIDFISSLHKSTKRDYLARVNDKEFPKDKAATLAKKWDFDYWDGDRRINYGGYKYINNRWNQVINSLYENYNLSEDAKILDIGCGKGFFLYDLLKLKPNSEVAGIDISKYAIKNAKEEIKNKLVFGNATNLPWEDNYFDLVVSITTLHNLYVFDLEKALKEMERVGKNKYLCVESYRNEKEKANLLYWQVTCEAFNTPDEWRWWFKHTNYTGDYSFIYFE